MRIEFIIAGAAFAGALLAFFACLDMRVPLHTRRVAVGGFLLTLSVGILWGVVLGQVGGVS